MTVRLVDLEDWHLERIRPQAAQAEEFAAAPGRPAGRGWAALVGQHPVCIGGWTSMGPDWAYSWAVLGEDVGPHMRSLTRAIRFQLDASPFARIEMWVAKGFPPACRWAELLGYRYEREGRLPDGREAWIYTRRS
jgi:hypothetical protein